MRHFQPKSKIGIIAALGEYHNSGATVAAETDDGYYHDPEQAEAARHLKLAIQERGEPDYPLVKAARRRNWPSLPRNKTDARLEILLERDSRINTALAKEAEDKRKMRAEKKVRNLELTKKGKEK